MKNKHFTSLLASFLSITCLASLVACGGKGNPPDGGNGGGANTGSDFPSTAEEYETWVDSWDEPGHLYIHYNRGDKGKYDDFCLWLWQKAPQSLEGTLWAYSGKTEISSSLTLRPMSNAWMSKADLGLSGKGTHIDQYGVIADVDLYSNNLVGGKTGKAVSFEGASKLGFLMVEQASMGGNTHWTSDGGKDSFIEGINEPTNWRGGVGTGSIHVYLSTGNFDNYAFSATGEVPSPKVNPVDTDTTGQFVSKTETITDNYGLSTTSDAFKDVGVGYQIFVASFRDSNGDGMGDIRGIIDSLDYLEDLGVEALWLTPIQQSGSYHGYDIDDYYAVDPKFGTVEEYRELIYKAHEKGMKVLMDLVLNHTSKSNVWFKKSQWAVNSGFNGAEVDGSGINWRDVYTWKYGTDKIKKYNPNTDSYVEITVAEDATSNNPSWYRDGESNYYYYGKFGSSMPEINFENKATRTLIKEMAKYWLGFGLDGFRLDAVKHIYMKDEVDNTGTDLIIKDVGSKNAYDDEKGVYVTKDFDYSSDMTKNIAWWKEFANDLKAVYPDCFLVGENFDGWGTRIAGYYQALDSQFSFSTYYHIPAYLYNNAGGASNFNMQASETFDIFKGDGLFPLAGQGVSVPGGRRSDYIDGAFTSNHDVMRAINQANGTGSKDGTTASDSISGKTVEINKAKIHAAITLLNSGLSWIYYGDELGMSSNTKTHIATYGNENSMDIWYRQPFLWNDLSARPNYQAGQYNFELDDYNLQLSNSQKGITYVDGNVTTTNTMYQWYKDIIEIKKMYPKGAHIEFDNCSTNVMKINVTGESGKNMVIFINVGISTNEYLVNVPGYNVVKQVNCSGVSQGSNIGANSYSVVALQQA